MKNDPQRALDRVTRWQEEGQKLVSLHSLNCDCDRCQEIQQIERERRWGK